MATATFKVTTSTNKIPFLEAVEGENQKQNALFKRIASNFNAATPGSYKEILELIGKDYNKEELKELLPEKELNSVTSFYVDKNVSTPWDPIKQGAKPPVGDFDSAYYAKQNPDLLQRWKAASTGVKIGDMQLPDVDITSRYTQDTFLHQHYSSTGKQSGLRGNPVQETVAANTYEEDRRGLTDAERQKLRDSYLGAPGIEGPLPVDATLEQLVNQQTQKKFQFLVEDVLSKTLNEVTKARQREQQLDFMRAIPGFDEIYSARSSVKDSILGDSGLGGFLSLMGTEERKRYEGSVESMLGISNDSMSYNWQKWFDEQLTQRYETLEEVMNPADAKEAIKVDREFAKTFIDDYLRPRFDNSKSMSEFISYMNLREDEQNVLQTQTTSNKLRQLATEKINSFVGELAKASKGVFDPNFYFEPEKFVTDSAKANLYKTQAAEVSRDWEAAQKDPSTKINGLTWEQWGYQYGVDLKNKNDFAKLHYEVVGKNKGFDPSADMPNIMDLNEFIYNNLTPYLEARKEEFGDRVFLPFLTPDQLATQLVSSLDPMRTPEAWDAVMERYGISGQGKTVDEVKNLILEVTRTVPAADIRDRLLELNKKDLKPTQERLGVEYIQRESDYKKEENKGETALYRLFKQSGFGGTEDEFYRDFMSDTSREEQKLISGLLSGKDESLRMDFSDPFAALESVERFGSLFETKPQTKETDKDKEKQETSYFRLYGDDSDKLKKDPSLAGMFDSFGSGSTLFGF